MIQFYGGRIGIGTAWEGFHDKVGRVEIYCEPRDLWIGVFVAKRGPVYVCPLPCVVIRISRGRRS